MQFQNHYNRFLLSLEGTKNIYVSFCENIISFCAPRTFRFADYMSFNKCLKVLINHIPFFVLVLAFLLEVRQEITFHLLMI